MISSILFALVLTSVNVFYSHYFVISFFFSILLSIKLKMTLTMQRLWILVCNKVPALVVCSTELPWINATFIGEIFVEVAGFNCRARDENLADLNYIFR